MKERTLYEVLEVSENASEEVIEKAYKVLAKKYHPDLQSQDKKQIAENKMKQINEAYEILGNETKRKEYDIKLEQERSKKKLENQSQSNSRTYDEYNQYKSQNTYSQYDSDGYNTHNQYNSDNSHNMKTDDFDYEKERLKYEKKLQKEEAIQRKRMQESLNEEYQNAYYDYLRSLGFKVKRGWSKESIKDFFMVILILVVIFVILWFIPPTHDWMVNFYEGNPILKTIIDIIIAIVTGIFKGIWNFITGLFAQN